jgi:hypothetical protein
MNLRILEGYENLCTKTCEKYENFGEKFRLFFLRFWSIFDEYEEYLKIFEEFDNCYGVISFFLKNMKIFKEYEDFLRLKNMKDLEKFSDIFF